MALPATDNFNRADEDPLSNGGKWTVVTSFNSLKIVSYACKGPAGSAGNYWNADTFNDNQYAQCTVSTFANATGPTVRNSTTAATFYLANIISTTTIQFYKCISGSYTQLGSNVSVSLSTTDVIKISAEGQNINLYINGTFIDSRSDSDITSGYAGLFCYGQEAICDNWEGGNVGGGGFTAIRRRTLSGRVGSRGA